MDFLPPPPPPVRVGSPSTLLEFVKDVSFRLGQPPHSGPTLLAAFSIALEVCTTPKDTLNLGNLTVIQMQQVIDQVANGLHVPNLDLSSPESAMIALTKMEETTPVKILRHAADCYIRCFLPSAVEEVLCEQIIEIASNKLAELRGSARESAMSPTQVAVEAAAADPSAIDAARTLQDLPMGRTAALEHALVLATAGNLTPLTDSVQFE